MQPEMLYGRSMEMRAMYFAPSASDRFTPPALVTHTDGAFQRAKEMDFRQWVNCLRNALAHGGIAFLDKNGHQTFGDSAKMYAFVSGKYDKNNREQLIGIKALRIDETEFREFLRLWVAWLEKSGISLSLAA